MRAPASSPVLPAPPPAAPAAPPEDGIWSRTTADLRVTLPDNVVLRGDDIRTSRGSMGIGDLNLTVGGSLTVRKRAGAEPEVVGAVEAVRGFYQFQGRRFDVERGSAVNFRGSAAIVPALNVTAQREVSGIMTHVRVTGSARRPVLTLSSEPPLDEGDVLSLIVFNQPINQLGESQQLDLVGRAGDLALGALANTVADSIGGALNVDLFEIRAPGAGRAGEVNVGNQVSERLFVGFRQQFGESDASQLSLEYRLTEALRLLTSLGHGVDRNTTQRRADAAGLDLVYTLRY
jgi:translocation and assembly module TamB